MTYTTQDKLIAVGLIERNDGVLSREVLQEIRTLLDAPKLNKSTVFRWWQSRAELQPGAAKMQPEKKETAVEGRFDDQDWVDATLKQYYAEVSVKYLRHALKSDTIDDMKGKDAVMTAAIATDKMRLLLNLPTEIVMMLPDVLAAIERAGLNASDVFNEILRQTAETKAQSD